MAVTIALLLEVHGIVKFSLHQYQAVRESIVISSSNSEEAQNCHGRCAGCLGGLTPYIPKSLAID